MKFRSVFLLIIAALAGGLVSCRSVKSLREQVEDIPAKNFENYDFSKDSELIDRVNASSGLIVDYMRRENERNNLYVLSEEESTLLEEYLGLLPDYYVKVLKERLLGIYFIENMFGSGMADYVLSDADEVYATLVLNPIVLRMTLPELLTWKENTCFKNDDDALSLEIDLPDEYMGLLYILMHECTHIVDYVERITPYVEPNMKELGLGRESGAPFTDEYWSDYGVLKENVNLYYKDRLFFYTDDETEKLSDSEIRAVYEEFMTTPFVTVYSYYSWAEDLADFAAMYYLTHVLGMTYVIGIFENGTTVFEYEPMKNTRVAARIEYLNLFD